MHIQELKVTNTGLWTPEKLVLFNSQNPWQYRNLSRDEREQYLRLWIGAAEYESEDHVMVQAWDHM
jgi:hypothetical protein